MKWILGAGQEPSQGGPWVAVATAVQCSRLVEMGAWRPLITEGTGDQMRFATRVDVWGHCVR